MIVKGCKISIDERSIVLYLGAASGTTVSHISDICARGIVYAVEFARKPMLDLIKLCELRKNIIPIFADASRPKEYASMVSEVDLIYQDVAQRDQSKIAKRNADLLLKDEGFLMLMLKARSIDSSKRPKDVISEELKRLIGFEVIKNINLEPFHRDHAAIIAIKRGEDADL
jgi:fibrillarin-like pre-rRNA processing protein